MRFAALAGGMSKFVSREGCGVGFILKQPWLFAVPRTNGRSGGKNKN
jgi:hypothetical protein